MKPEADTNEFQKFDTAMTKIMAVSHDELKRREGEWKKQRKRRKRAVRKNT